MVGVTGIGSGINIDSIVASMVAAEKTPKLTQLTNLEKKTTTQITAVGALKSAISDFQTALSAINKPELFQARSAKSSNTDLLAVKAGVSAGVGTYQVDVRQLAASSKVALAAIAPNGAEPATFGNGTLTVMVGGVSLPEITVDGTNNTLAGIRDSINKAGVEQGVTATIVTDDAGSRLVLNSSKSGAGEDISVVAPADDGTGSANLSQLAFSDTEVTQPADPAAARMLTKAQSAEVYVDGLKVTSKTNSLDTAIEGVTLDLKGITETGKPITVSVDLDKAGVKTNVEKFVDAYNKLIGVINAQTKVTPVGEGKAPVTGALVGDATARNLLNTIRNELVNVQGSGAVRALTDIGITTQKDGTLAIDSAKLDKSMTDSFEGISSLFSGDKGLATRLDEKLKPYTETGGILEQRNKVMSETISKIDKQKVDLDRRITSLQDRLYKQFNAMDALVGQLSNTSASLLASLENLPWAAGNSKR
ncbi:flagellar filament capping protein FliD [Stutzerimonas chloritidismutans]|nr:flagellar filament capping protein FliD [[Pseudomonas] sp. BICA1-14]KJS77151.1 MAG: branched-chain alpha-keto acid dehydrogenase subunit E2 [[Pseudomonas] sp. BICA1-14]